MAGAAPDPTAHLEVAAAAAFNDAVRRRCSPKAQTARRQGQPR